MKFLKLPLIIITSLIAFSCSPTKPKDATPPVLSATPSFLNVAPPVLKVFGKKKSVVYLQSLDIQVEVTGNIASTRYTMVFKNRTDRILEGELTLPLPDGSTVTYYALDINGKMRDAVPVKKEKATEVFEEEQVDPGLLERVKGNNFRTRISIPANGTRTISIGYEEELQLENNLLRYGLPMVYPDTLEKFSASATVWQSGKEPYHPSNALNFALPAPMDIPRVIMQQAQGNNYFFASVASKMEMRKKQWDNNLAIIWDVSLSGSQRNLQREIEMLDIIFSEKKNAKIHLYFLNNTFKKIAKGNWNELKSILEKAVYDGGTDFSKINLKEIEGDEILFFSDGISTLSDADFLKNDKAKHPVHCVVSSSKSDYGAMKLIASKTKGKFINVNALSNEKLKNELLNETLQFLGAEHGKSVREVYPSVATPVYGNFSVAGISEAKDEEITLLFGFGNKVMKKIKVKIDARNVDKQGNVHRIWVQKKIAELDLSYEKNRKELTELGQQFGIVTRNTSLIVLETLRDYVDYGIEPPATEPELRAEYQSRRKQDDKKSNILDSAIAAAENLKKWWNTDFTPKKDEANEEGCIGELGAFMGGSVGGIGTRTVCGLRIDSNSSDIDSVWTETFEPEPIITIKPIREDNEYLKKLTGDAAENYQIYLKLRQDYGNSPTFYFDIANWFYTHKNKEIALRILTSIADLELENASLYRLLGYRFKEYGEYALEKFVCQKVIQWRPMEPQSYRDYALALADNNEMQAALDSLYSLLLRPYSESIIERSKGIAEVVVMEINNLISKNSKLNTSKIDKRLIMDIPVDIRVVINWNMDNADINLYVKDPSGEECYYWNEETRIGGRISTDNTGGDGPEQFLLKKAIKGKYQIYVDYFGDRQFTEDGPSTIMAEIFTKYSDKTEQRKVVSLQMSKVEKEVGKKEDEKVEVAEFEF